MEYVSRPQAPVDDDRVARSRPVEIATNRLLGLQRSAGNAVVSRLITARSRAIAVQRVPERTPPMEYIASSTQAELTGDYFPDRILQIMRRHHLGFLEAARMVASGDLTGHAEHATRSADLSTEAPSHAAAIAFAVSSYPQEDPHHQLAGVATDLRPGGLARQALTTGGIGPVTVVRNPTAAQISEGIRSAIINVATEPGTGGRRLTIFFDGHGDSDGMVGTDEETFTIAQLMQLNDLARDFRVQLVVVANACLQGANTLLAERLANDQLQLEVAHDVHLTAAQREADYATISEIGRMINTGADATEAIDRVVTILDQPHRIPLDPVAVQHWMTELRSQLHAWEPLALASAGLVTRIHGLRDEIAATHTWTRVGSQRLLGKMDMISNQLIEEIAVSQERLNHLVHDAAGPATFDGILHSE